MDHSQEESCRGAASERSRRQRGVLQTMLRIWDVIPKVVNLKGTVGAFEKDRS